MEWHDATGDPHRGREARATALPVAARGGALDRAGHLAPHAADEPRRWLLARGGFLRPRARGLATVWIQQPAAARGGPGPLARDGARVCRRGRATCRGRAGGGRALRAARALGAVLHRGALDLPAPRARARDAAACRPRRSSRAFIRALPCAADVRRVRRALGARGRAHALPGAPAHARLEDETHFVRDHRELRAHHELRARQRRRARGRGGGAGARRAPVGRELLWAGDPELRLRPACAARDVWTDCRLGRSAGARRSCGSRCASRRGAHDGAHRSATSRRSRPHTPGPHPLVGQGDRQRHTASSTAPAAPVRTGRRAHGASAKVVGQPSRWRSR